MGYHDNYRCLVAGCARCGNPPAGPDWEAKYRAQTAALALANRNLAATELELAKERLQRTLAENDVREANAEDEVRRKQEAYNRLVAA